MKKYKVIFSFFLIVCAFLCVKLEWQYDEAWSYLGTLGSSASDVFQYKYFRFANNHVINSLYINLLQGYGVANVAFYRLLSLLSFVVYSFFYYKYVKYKNPTVGKSNVLQSYLVCIFPFILPFFPYFPLARGYSMAIAATMASLYYLIKINDHFDTKQFLLFILFGSLSALSIFSFIYPFAAMVLFVLFSQARTITMKLYSAKGGIIYISVIVFLLLLVYYIYGKGKIISAYDPNIAGGENLFRNGMLSSLLSFMSLHDITANTLLFKLFRVSIVVTLVPVLYIFYKHFKLPVEHKLIAVSILLTVVSHVLFKSKYPYMRTTSYLLLFLYLPIIVIDVNTKFRSVVYNLHFVVLTLIGAYNIRNQIISACAPNTEDALIYINDHFPGQRVYVDYHDPNIDLYNLLYFHKRIPIISRNGTISDLISSGSGKPFVIVSTRDSLDVYKRNKLANTGFIYGNRYLIYNYAPGIPTIVK